MPRTPSLPLAALVLATVAAACGDVDPVRPTFRAPTEISRVIGAVAPSAFTQVSAGYGSYSCGVRGDGTIACWGFNANGQATPPAGDTFTSLSAGNFHNCALTSAGGVACWGAGYSGETSPPPHLPQTIAYISTPPAPAVLGTTYGASATGGASGNAVVFTSVTPAVCSVGSSAGNAAAVTLNAVGTCTVAADQAGNATYVAAPQAMQSFGVVYAFSGFLAPVDDPGPNADVINRAKAGAGIAVKFALNGDQGLEIFRAGYPRFVSAPCTADEAENVIDDASTSPAGLQYDESTGQYTYVWKTNRAWAGVCGTFELGLVDGTTHHALFHFVR